MIKNIFFPEKINNYYLFAKRIIGIEMTKTDIFATQILTKSRAITVEKIIHVPLDANGSYQEKVIAGLISIFAQVDRYDYVHTALPSSLATYKTLKLPFTSYEKIKMVIGYEIEPLLPFSLGAAVIDFIITKVNAHENSAQVLVAAVQKQHIADHLALFQAAGISPSVITLDMIALYDIFKRFPDFATITHNKNSVLLDLGPYETRIAYLHDGELRLVRTLAKGYVDQAKVIGKKLQISTTQAIEHLLRFGLEPNHNTVIEDVIKESMQQFGQALSFTLNSFTQQAGGIGTTSIDKIFLFGQGSTIKGIASFIQAVTGINTQQIKTTELFHNHTINLKQANGGMPSDSLVSFGAAIASLQENPFNLIPREFDTKDYKTVGKQLLIAVAFIGILLGSLLVTTIMQIHQFNNEIYDSTQEVINTVKKLGVKIEDESIDDPQEQLPELVGQAEQLVKNNKRLVSEFSSSQRASFLTFLLELSNLNKTPQGNLGLRLTKLTITPEKIIMSGSVNEKAQAGLKQAIKDSPFFGSPTPSEELDKTSFNNVQIPLKNSSSKGSI